MLEDYRAEDSERCALCGCLLTRGDFYAQPTTEGRSHATRHHYVAERFFGRSATRPGEPRVPILTEDPWGGEGMTGLFCYECHEILLHNPVLLPEDIELLHHLIVLRGLDEEEKPGDYEKLAGRIGLLHEILALGICGLLAIEEGRAL